MNKKRIISSSILVTMVLASCSKNLANLSPEKTSVNTSNTTNTISNTTPITDTSITQQQNSIIPSENKSIPEIAVPKIETINTNSVISSIINSNIELSTPVSTQNDFNNLEIKNALLSYHDLDSVFDDSESMSKIPEDNNILTNSFSTKAIRNQNNQAVVKVNIPAPRVINNNFNNRNDRNEYLKESLKDSRQELSSQVKYEKQDKDRELVNKNYVEKTQYQDRYKKTREEVKCSKEVNFKVASGDLVRKNEFEFKREKDTKLDRVNKFYEKDSNKLMKYVHNFESRTVFYVQNATRVVTFTADGGKNITTECVTKFNDGKERSVQETRILDRFGKGKGFGFIKIKFANGKVCNNDLDFVFDNKIKTSSVKDTNSSNEVKIIDSCDGNATVIDNNKSEVVNISDKNYSNTFTQPIPVPTPTATPEPTSTPEIQVTPQPTSTPKATATPSKENEDDNSKDVKATPQPASTPKATATPSKENEDDNSKDVKATPQPTSTPKATATPSKENEDDNSKDVKATPQPTSTPKATATPSEKSNNGLGDTKDSDNTVKGTDTSNPGQNKS